MVRIAIDPMRCALAGMFIGWIVGAQTDAFADQTPCTPEWSQPSQPVGVEGAQTWPPGEIYAIATFDDGSGPATYVGGQFISAGGVDVGNIARWDGRRWSAVGSYGFDGAVYALAVFDCGSGPALYAAGAILEADEHQVQRIAKWDGTSWTSLAEVQQSGVIYALQVFDDGTGPALYVGGSYSPFPDGSGGFVRRWDGTNWSTLGTSYLTGAVRAMTVFDDGSGPALYVGGRFTSVSGTPAFCIARWNGQAWSEVGGGFPGSFPRVVRSLVGFDDGSGPALYVGAEAHLPHHEYLARWTGTEWEALGTGPVNEVAHSRVTALLPAKTEEGTVLLVGGFFPHPPPSSSITALGVWDGTSLKLPTIGAPLGTGTGTYAMMARPRDDGPDALTIGGSFSHFWVGGPFHHMLWSKGIVEFDGELWRALQRGVGPEVFAMAEFDDGVGSELYAFGTFRVAHGTMVNAIATQRDGMWYPAMEGVTRPSDNDPSVFVAGRIHSVTIHHDDDEVSLVVGGYFTRAGDVPVGNIAMRRNGEWHAMGYGLGWINAVMSYQPVHEAKPVVIAGGSSQAFGNIAQWDGAAWHPMGSGLNGWVRALAVFDDGNGPALYAGGSFTMAGDVPALHLARWDGVEWTSVGGGTDGKVKALHVFNDGSGPALYVGGNFIHAGHIVVNRIAKWDGRTWSALGDGVVTDLSSFSVRAIGSFDDGSGPALYSGSLSPNSAGTQLRTVGRWDGRSWITYEQDIVGLPHVIFELPESDASGPGLFVGGFFPGAAGQTQDGARILSGCPVTEVLCPADLNGDHQVDYRDLTKLLAAWGPCNECAADFNGDGVVNGDDLAILIAEWGPCADE